MDRKQTTSGRQRAARAAVVVAKQGSRRSHLVQSFHSTYRNRVSNVANRATYFEELAETFPALLFALATNFGTTESRRDAVTHLMTGSRLREAANALGLPWWMRKLPPQAFNKKLGHIPDDPVFAARIVNLLPDEPGLAAKWLDRVFQAYRTCGTDFALWVARNDRFHAPLVTDPALPYVAAWAWFAKHPDTLGARLLRRPWTPTMRPRRAFDELTTWRKRIRLALTLSALHREPWLSGGTIHGYDFVELVGIEDFIAESDAMDNCLDSFAEKLEAGTSYVFSIRQNGIPVADIEIGAHPLEPHLPTIVQLRGPRNRRANPQIWRAAYAWLGGQELRPAPALVINSTARRRAWRALWKPYLAVLEPEDRAAFERIAMEFDKLRGRRRAARRTSSLPQPRPERVEDTEMAAT